LPSGSFDFVNFTGSVGGGKAIERAAAGTFTGMGLELGGKDPGYVMADADLDWAVDTLMDGAMFNSGQCCCGIERIYVARPLYDAFVEKAAAWVSSGLQARQSAGRRKPRSGRWPMCASRRKCGRRPRRPSLGGARGHRSETVSG
jgi:acyl-CoA reductase-like NAD-dependent aldehyde dehydrogenase